MIRSGRQTLGNPTHTPPPDSTLPPLPPLSRPHSTTQSPSTSDHHITLPPSIHRRPHCPLYLPIPGRPFSLPSPCFNTPTPRRLSRRSLIRPAPLQPTTVSLSLQSLSKTKTPRRHLRMPFAITRARETGQSPSWHRSQFTYSRRRSGDMGEHAIKLARGA